MSLRSRIASRYRAVREELAMPAILPRHKSFLDRTARRWEEAADWIFAHFESLREEERMAPSWEADAPGSAKPPRTAEPPSRRRTSSARTPEPQGARAPERSRDPGASARAPSTGKAASGRDAEAPGGGTRARRSPIAGERPRRRERLEDEPRSPPRQALPRGETFENFPVDAEERLLDRWFGPLDRRAPPESANGDALRLAGRAALDPVAVDVDSPFRGRSSSVSMSERFDTSVEIPWTVATPKIDPTDAARARREEEEWDERGF